MKTILKVSIKAVDSGIYSLNGEDYEGYVPDFFPEEHYGDYVYLDIDVNTGKITNWKKPTKTQLKKYFKEVK